MLEEKLLQAERRIDRDWLKWGEYAYFILAERRIRGFEPPHSWIYFARRRRYVSKDRVIGTLAIWKAFAEFVLDPERRGDTGRAAERRRLMYSIPWPVLRAVAPYVCRDTVDIILERVGGMKRRQAVRFCKELLHIHKLPERVRVRPRRTVMVVDARREHVKRLGEVLEGYRAGVTTNDQALEALLDAAAKGLGDAV